MTLGNKNLPITYREYKFAEEFPILLMEGKSTSPQIDFIHFHNCIEIAFCRKGTMTWNLENRIFSLTPGNICFLPPFFTHGSFFPVLPEAAPKETVPKETTPKEVAPKKAALKVTVSEANISPGIDTMEDAPDTDVSCVYLFFNPEQLLAPFYPNGLPREFTWYQYTDFPKILPAALFPEQVKLIRMIIQELQEKKEHYRQSVRGMVETLLILLYRQHLDCPVFGGTVSALPQLFPAVSFLDTEYASELDTAHLAHLCGLSQRQFLLYFQECFSQTPLQYLRTVRIQKACRLLTSTETGILDIALQTGFRSLSSFNRYFHKIVGSNPQAFRNDRRVIVKKDPRYAPYHAE